MTQDAPPTIAGYRIVRKLGEGGVGAVFLAEPKDEAMPRRVAVKVLHPQAALNESDIRRFAREGHLGRALDHPHILPIYAFEQDGDASFLVMEYVDGQTLSKWLKGQTGGRSLDAASLRERLTLLSHIAGALALAHRNGIVPASLQPARVSPLR